MMTYFLLRPWSSFVMFCLFVAPLSLRSQTVRLQAEEARIEGTGLRVVRPSADAAVTPASQKDEVEHCSSQKASGYSGQGYVSCFGHPGDRLVFTYQAASAGAYHLSIGFRCPRKCAYALMVNELGITGSFSPQTPGHFEMQDAGKIELASGANTLVVEGGWGNYDLDFLELSPAGSVHGPLPVTTPAVDPRATREARALLKKLDDLYGDGVGKGTLMGVYSDEDAGYIVDKTGSRPAIMGDDLSFYSPANQERNPRPSEIVERMIEHGHEGYVLTFSWHWVPPFGLLNRMIPAENGKPAVDARYNRGFYTDSTNFDVSIAMADSQSLEHTLLLRDIDAIAVQLKKLQDAGVPILWRPLHEAQGGWFWWGAKGPGPFVELWRLLYDRLVNVDGIHNLVWVYTSGDDPAWYPGDAYVDVVGIDAYPKDLRDPQSELWTRLLPQFDGRKIIALSEFGGVPDIERMHRLGIDFSYAVSWKGDEGPRKNTPEALKAIYAAPTALKGPVFLGSH